MWKVQQGPNPCELVCAEEPFAQTVHDALHDVVCHHCYDVLAEGRVLFDGDPLEPRRPSKGKSEARSCGKCARSLCIIFESPPRRNPDFPYCFSFKM